MKQYIKKHLITYNMKKIIFVFILFIVFSCANKRNVNYKQSLVEIITQQENGGSNIHFFEIITESSELKMLLNDPHLKKKINPTDIQKSNFVVMSLGKKATKGNTITIIDSQETKNNIIITVKENEPVIQKDSLVEPVYPYTVIKINSKKDIIFK